jgi:hypothetical protein
MRFRSQCRLFISNHNYAALNKQPPGIFLTAPLGLTSKGRANFLLLSKRNYAILPVENLKVCPSMKEKPDVLQGTLALMVLKTLDHRALL